MKPSTAGGAIITCTVQQPVDVCPTTDGCDENTRIGVLTTGTVTVFERQGPWHKVKLPAGEGWAYSGEGYEYLTSRSQSSALMSRPRRGRSAISTSSTRMVLRPMSPEILRSRWMQRAWWSRPPIAQPVATASARP
jgi:hypothetical protein